MRKKLLTIDDLYNFCVKHNYTHFSSEEHGYKLFVHVPGLFQKRETDDYTLFADVKVLHTGRNLNNSSLTDKAAKHIMKTLAYKPVLANFTDVNGERDFTSHDMEFYTDENGEEKINYIEKQVGCFTADKPYMKYDEENGHDYMYARIAIPREYTDAADIIERKDGTAVSVELEVLSMSYDAKDRCLLLEDAEATGLTLLGVNPETGEKVKPGMQSAHVSLESFSEENNSIFSPANGELINEIKRFNKNFELLMNSNNNNNNTKGKEEEPMFESLLEKYSVTAEDVDFEYEGLSDEELKAKFAEKFDKTEAEAETESEENTETEESEEGTGESTEDTEEGVDDTPADGDGAEFSEDTDTSEETEESEEETEETSENTEEADTQKYELTLPDGTKKEFSLSLSEIQSAIFNLVNDTYAELDNTLYAVEVFEDEKNVVMIDYFNGAAYRQQYKRKKDNFSLEGDRCSVRSVWMSADEEKAFEDMKANFSEVSEKLANYEAEPEKVELLNSEAYSSIADTDEYKDLAKRETYFVLGKDELEKKLDEVILKYAKENKLNFAAKTEPKPKTEKVNRKGFVTGLTGGGKSRYGNLFAK